ncbi:hypothetical protein AKJ09_08326 [Labilithrix luteola]|uniref:Bacteriophage Mu GpT domain-containing protein n=1 Tax=Labilithrix luteola TaxID=1391654 RepID=A0A0K1Q7E2_9BACT|nr:hypothetical protein AKJ09_08326 [Labilithrix luteola]
MREFNERYLLAISAAAAPSWADRFVMGVGGPRVTFPIAMMSTKFLETKEASGRFKTMQEKSFDLRVAEFDAGYEAKFLDIKTSVFAYRNWSQVPARFLTAQARHVCEQLAKLLEAGTTIASPWDDVNFFSAAHKINPSVPSSTVWSNFQATATDPTDIAKLQAESTAMRFVPDENGSKLGVEPDEIWLPTEKFQVVSDKLNQERLANGESNPMMGKLKPVHVPEFTDPNDFYLVDSKLFAKGLDPMIAADYRPADSLGLRFWDESSDFFKDTGKIKVSQHIWHGFSLVFPHAIRRITGA